MPLEDIIDERIRQFFSNPVDWPRQAKSWIPAYVEQQGISITTSQLVDAYTVADSVSDLGQPEHGRTVMLRVGSSPFTFLQLTADEVYGKWVSDQIWFSFQLTANMAVTNSAGTWVTVSAANFPSVFLPDFKALYDAGARPQVRLSAQLRCSPSGTTSLRTTINEYNDGGTIVFQLATGGQIDLASATATYKVSAWSALTFGSAPTKTHALAFLQYDSDQADSQGMSDAGMAIRWVADTV